MLTFPSVPPATAERMLTEWLDIMRRKENGIIVFPPKGGAYRRIEHLMAWKSLREKRLGPTAPQYRLHSWSLLPFRTATSQAILESVRREADLSGKPTSHLPFIHYFLLYDADRWFSDSRTDILVALSELAERDPAYRFLLFCELDVTHPAYSHLLTDKTTLGQNIRIHPLYSIEDMRYFLGDICRHWNETLDPKTIQSILDYVGPHTWLIKEAARLLLSTPTLPVQSLLSQPSMQMKVAAIWNGFSGNEQLILKHIIGNGPTQPTPQRPEHDHLYRIGILDGKPEENQHCTLPILTQYIREQMITAPAAVSGEHIYIGSNDISAALTKSEHLILTLLIEANGSIVPREAVATAVWGDDYTDWALDRLISRLRKKLGSLSIDPSTLVTLKKRGFRWNRLQHYGT